MPNDNTQSLVADLADHHPPGLFNPWRERCEQDLHPDAPQQRRIRYLDHLNIHNPRFLLVGEAAGYQGCRYSGIPFTSERQLLAGEIPRQPPAPRRLTSRPRPWSEPSATIVWRTLKSLGIEHQTILWNAVPWHPHKPGDPWTNRTPTEKERAAGMAFLERVVHLFPQATLIAVGRKAESSLKNLGLRAITVRHPANGGATRFAVQLAAAATVRKCLAQ